MQFGYYNLRFVHGLLNKTLDYRFHLAIVKLTAASHNFLIPFWLPVEHGASMKLSVSLQFLNLDSR
jgi:hypothetical protein